MIETVCIRCGKTRILLKRWEEKGKGPKMVLETSVCPDRDCQKIVDEKFEQMREKKRLLKEGK